MIHARLISNITIRYFFLGFVLSFFVIYNFKKFFLIFELLFFRGVCKWIIFEVYKKIPFRELISFKFWFRLRKLSKVKVWIIWTHFKISNNKNFTKYSSESSPKSEGSSSFFELEENLAYNAPIKIIILLNNYKLITCKKFRSIFQQSPPISYFQHIFYLVFFLQSR